MKDFAWLLCALALLVSPSRGAAQVIVPPERGDLVSPKITDSVSFDAASGLYTYSYSVKNLNGAKQNIATFVLDTTAIVSDPTSPSGWSFEALTMLGWSAISFPPGFVDDGSGNLPESPDTIQPGQTLAGFSFKSPSAPGSVTFYAQGFVPIPAVTNDVEELAQAGYDPALLDFTQNSESGTTDGPASECSDGADNDGDGATDYPADSGCFDARWPFESPACANGVDDDGDGDVDFPADTGCHGAYDLSEVADCADGFDNDFDTAIDFPADPGCAGPSDPSEDLECSDGIDNDGDGQVDLDDPGCAAIGFDQEDPACDDGVDNDGDGDVDYPADAQCTAPFDISEEPDCNDGLDNDHDGTIDLADSGCRVAGDLTELPDCSDGIDNDGDGLIDAGDPQCRIDPGDPSVSEACGGDSDGNGIGDFCECGDGICNAVEDSCSCEVDCGPPPFEQDDLTCSDGLDNDCDGDVDCEDSGCSSRPSCRCDNDGTCEAGEDCASCPADCPSGSLATCGNGVCEAADGEDCLSCAQDCNGKQKGKESKRFCCGAGGGQNSVTCSDARCTSRKVSCTDSPAGSFCCGDGLCQGAEATLMCTIDCGP